MANEYKLEEIFKISGVPDITFIEPLNFAKLKVALRTPGRGVVLEGPSGVGKTVAVSKAIEQLGLSSSVERLSGRIEKDRARLKDVINHQHKGFFLIDDFHRLPQGMRDELSDLLKLLADQESKDTKLVLVGINFVGQSLVKVSPDLANRIDIITFENNPDSKIDELIGLGELALNIKIASRDAIIKRAIGSFYLTQLLCHEACIQSGVTEAASELKSLSVSFNDINEQVMNRLELSFGEKTRRFATGPRFRRGGRAPYLRVLKWLSESDSWSIQLDELLNKNINYRGSVGQIVDKGYLSQFVEGYKGAEGYHSIVNYDSNTKFLSAEDPQFMYYIKNIDWGNFSAKVGFTQVDFSSKYDCALSFAGERRELAEKLANDLQENELSVFYDNQEQHLMTGENLEKYLGPIYESEADFIVVLLSKEYPNKVWARFERDKYEGRMEKGEVIPIKFTDVHVGAFDKLDKVVYLEYDPAGSLSNQLQGLSDTIRKKIESRRNS